MWHGQMLPGQMSPWQLESVLDVSSPWKFHQDRFSNHWDMMSDGPKEKVSYINKYRQTWAIPRVASQLKKDIDD